MFPQILIVVGLFLAVWLASSVIVGPPFTYVGWEYEPSPGAVVRQLIAPNLVELVLWLFVIAGLGWRRAVGLLPGTASLWGIVPLALFWIAMFLTAGLWNVVSKGPGVVGLAAVGFFIAALTEEIACRGFLLHGLTRRLGGTRAVLLSSAVFAALHVPTYVGQGVEHLTGPLLAAFGFGVMMCRIRVATGSLWFPTAIHAMYNLILTGLAVWAFPQGQSPAAFGALAMGFDAMGILLAYRLRLGDAVKRGLGRLVSSPPSTGHDHTPAEETWWSYAAARATPGPDTFERFTPAGRRTIRLAQEEARAESAATVATEHLLLGLIHESDGVAAVTLRASGITVGPADRLEELERSREADIPDLPFDMRTKLALQLAIREAGGWGQDQVGCEHLLLALTAIRAGDAFRVLRASGVEPGTLRRTLTREMTNQRWAASGGRAGGAADPATPG